MDVQHPQTNGGRLLKRGDSYDIEDWRTTHRLRVAQGILKGLGFTPTWPSHSDKCIRSEANRSRRCFGFNYICDDADCPMRHNPAPTWPAECTGPVFDAAYTLACAVQDARGAAAARAMDEGRRQRDEAQAHSMQDQAEVYVGLGDFDGGAGQ